MLLQVQLWTLSAMLYFEEYLVTGIVSIVERNLLASAGGGGTCTFHGIPRGQEDKYCCVTDLAKPTMCKEFECSVCH